MTTNVKQAIHELIEKLPDACTWEDVMYAIYVREKIEAGLLDIEAGRVTPHDEVFAEFEE